MTKKEWKAEGIMKGEGQEREKRRKRGNKICDKVKLNQDT